MEQTRYWMWSRRKLNGIHPHIQSLTPTSSYNDSWEEQAFKEERLGGCIWPPRSYSCSFCRREFRSAQALGGHMNVHRRDRARLKQSSPPTPTPLAETSGGGGAAAALLQHHLHYHPHPNQVCTMVCNPNPNNNHGVVVPSPLSPSRVSMTPTQGNCSERAILVSPSYSSSSIIQDQCKHSLFATVAPRSLSDSFAFKAPALDQGLRLGREELSTREIAGKRQRDSCSVEEEETTSSSKRQRIDSPIEELDLELRLGSDRPKVKQNCSDQHVLLLE